MEAGSVFRSAIDEKVWIAMPAESTHHDTVAGSLRACRGWLEDYVRQDCAPEQVELTWTKAHDDMWGLDVEGPE